MFRPRIAKRGSSVADDNTLPKFSEDHVAALQPQGIESRLVYADGASHGSVLRSPEFFALATEMAAQLSHKEH